MGYKPIYFSLFQELSDIREAGLKHFCNIQVDEANMLCWQGLIVPVSTEWVQTNSQTLLMSPVFHHIFVVVPRTVLLMKRERLGLSSPSLQNTLSSRQRSHSRQKSTILTSMKRVRCVCQSLVLKTGNRPQKLTKVRDIILPLR